VAIVTVLGALAVFSWLDGARGVASLLAIGAIVVAVRIVRECAASTKICLAGIAALAQERDTWLLGSGEPVSEVDGELGVVLRQRLRRTQAAIAYAQQADQADR
jgi:hypothetical protein